MRRRYNIRLELHSGMPTIIEITKKKVEEREADKCQREGCRRAISRESVNNGGDRISVFLEVFGNIRTER